MLMVEKSENAKNSVLVRPMFNAYSGSKSQGSIPPDRLQAIKVALVSMDCVLIGLQPILVHMSKNSEGKFSYNPVSVNFLTEVCKVVFAFLVLLFVGTGRPGTPMYRSLINFIRDAHHNRLLAVPASLYAINNYLKFVMQLHFKPTTTKMLGNLKIFTIAMLLKLVMKRTFTVIQWEALFLLVFGITVNQLSDCPGSGSGEPLSFLAVVYTAGVVTIPAGASVYNEFALKKHMETSVHLQNFFLYFYGMLFNLLGLCALAAAGSQPIGSFLQGYSPVTMLLVVNNAAQGILSSFFYKFADTILKKYSSTMATIFTGIMSAALFSHHLTMNFVIGVSIVLISMHQFFTFSKQDGKKTIGKGKDDETKNGVKFTPSPSIDHLDMLSEASQLSHQDDETRSLVLPK